MSETPALMVQGTSSNAGKSWLAAALCRIFSDRGLRVMPFKAQNMTGSAYALPGGKRISGSQALQALAARQEPEAAMNPVLLMPRSELGSEVVLMGESHGGMSIAAYTRFKEETAFPAVKTAYDSLAARADIMVLEGAGSPAEINLKAHDIVNMRMAAYAGATVLLVGDIDRGGVFAHLYGTLELLPPAERDLIAGFVLNKFRGNASLLAPALEEITRRTGKPFLGVIPYLADCDLPQEDSLAQAEHGGSGMALTDPALDAQLDALAAHVLRHLDMPSIRIALGI